ncbi:hypothetical protein K474DRAFT_285490 [Panus rudis PR-1116 ss-1]|nr:hypothetical protein K474DRAFT_285490 [Panus rudis PR-1116 ss-1]
MALGITDDAYLVPGSQTVMVHVQTCTDERCQIHEIVLTTVRAEFDQVWLKAVDMSRALLSQCDAARLPPPPEWVTRHMTRLEEWEHHQLSSRASSNETIRPSSYQPASPSVLTLPMGSGNTLSPTLPTLTQPHAPPCVDQGLVLGQSSSTTQLQLHHATPVFEQTRTELPLYSMDWTDPFCANTSYLEGDDSPSLCQPSPLASDVNATRGRTSIRSPILGRIVKAKRSFVNLLARSRASAT